MTTALQIPTTEQVLARRDAEKFYEAAESAITAGDDRHADQMLGLYLDALRHVGAPYRTPHAKAGITLDRLRTRR